MHRRPSLCIRTSLTWLLVFVAKLQSCSTCSTSQCNYQTSTTQKKTWLNLSRLFASELKTVDQTTLNKGKWWTKCALKCARAWTDHNSRARRRKTKQMMMRIKRTNSIAILHRDSKRRVKVAETISQTIMEVCRRGDPGLAPMLIRKRSRSNRRRWTC